MTVQTRVGIPIVPPVALHVLILKIIYAALLKYEQITGVGVAFSEAPFALTDSSDWVKGSRVPDASFYLAERWIAYIKSTLDWHSKPFILVPDLCLEIAATSEKYFDVVEKVDHYLADGVKLIWVLNPRNKTVAVYTPGSDQITRLTLGATLSGGDILPGFTLSLKDIFPE